MKLLTCRQGQGQSRGIACRCHRWSRTCYHTRSVSHSVSRPTHPSSDTVGPSPQASKYLRADSTLHSWELLVACCICCLPNHLYTCQHHTQCWQYFLCLWQPLLQCFWFRRSLQRCYSFSASSPYGNLYSKISCIQMQDAPIHFLWEMVITKLSLEPCLFYQLERPMQNQFNFIFFGKISSQIG